MNRRELMKMAKQHHIRVASLSKAEIVRRIQRAEGNFDCYATASGGACDQPACAWREDCLTEATAASAAA